MLDFCLLIVRASAPAWLGHSLEQCSSFPHRSCLCPCSAYAFLRVVLFFPAVVALVASTIIFVVESPTLGASCILDCGVSDPLIGLLPLSHIASRLLFRLFFVSIVWVVSIRVSSCLYVTLILRLFREVPLKSSLSGKKLPMSRTLIYIN